MFFFSIAFVLAYLPRQTRQKWSCTQKEYHCNERNCTTAYIKELQKDPYYPRDCHSEKFYEMITCVAKIKQFCAGPREELSQSQIDSIRQTFMENSWCFEWYEKVDIPTWSPRDSRCSNTFSSNARDCQRTFFQKFAANMSDPALCPESAKLKRCMKNLMGSECTLSSSDQERLDLDFGDYNPYCANNRDPGATGNDDCYGVKELNNPYTSGGNGDNIFKCTFMEYICDIMKCNTAAVKGLHKDPKGDCSAKFNKMFSCVMKTAQICSGDVLSKSQIDSLRQNVTENFLCLDGGAGIPSPCSNTSSSDGNACIRTFKQKFAADKSDPALCPEFAQAKRCMKNLIHSDCQEELDFDFGDYNPYCANNRDPGATGNDQCYGVKELNNPFTSGTATSAGIKVALMFPFLLMMFFVKM